MDWYNVIVYRNRDDSWKPNKIEIDENHINMGYNDPYILLSNYKTSSFYGRWYKKIPKDLLKVFENYCKNEKQVLFLNTKNVPYNCLENFTFWANTVIKRVLKNKKASMNTLRHSYASYMMRTNPNMSLLMRKVLAKDMGHSMQETLAYDNIHNMNTAKK